MVYGASRDLDVAPDVAKTEIEGLKTDLITVPSSAPLTKVIATLRERNAYETFIVDDSKILMVSIRDVLRTKNIHSRKASSLAVQIPVLTAGSTIANAAELMMDHRVRALPIVDGKEALGEITTLAICKALSTAAGLGFTIDKIMTSHPITLDAHDRLGKAKAIMNRKNIDHLPILQDGKTVGVLTSHRLLDSIVPTQRSGKGGSTPERKGVNQLSVGGLMERPLICDVHEETSSVLRRMIDSERTCALVELGEELQGIVTYRDFVKLLVNRKKEVGIPVYMMGQPDNVFEAEAARAKFVRSINLLAKSFPEILEARTMIKTTSPKGERGRKRYEVKTSVYTPQKMFIHSESGWDLASIFDAISERLGKIVTKQTRRRSERTKRWNR
jgi:CBS domain-containing protein